MKFLKDRKAGMSVKAIILMAVSLLLIGVLAPIGIGLIANANTTNWDASVITVFQVLLPILASVGMALGYLKTR